MDFLNKTFKNRVTGDVFTIIDVYQNIAITSDKEKINTNILSNDKIFIPINNNLNESKVDDFVDPKKFFSTQETYNAFAEKIKQISLDKVPEDNLEIKLPTSGDESAIIISDTEDEIEELKRKYGATNIDDSLKKQNDAFSRILNDSEEQQIETPNVTFSKNITTSQDQPVSRFEVEREDPILIIFKNVKRNLDFSINIDIVGKIPRLDFIEMMEDSYENSIIEYLAQEFTNNILSDPSYIRSRIISEIKSMIDKKNQLSSEKNNKNEKLIDSTSDLKPTKRKPATKPTTKATKPKTLKNGSVKQDSESEKQKV